MPSARSKSRAVRIGAMALPVVFTAACAVFGRSGSTLPDHMLGHYSTVGQVQTAIIQGNLEAARESARYLAEHSTHEDLPQGVHSPVEDMRAYARSVSEAGSIAEAARCAAEIGGACGRCHEASGIGPKTSISFGMIPWALWTEPTGVASSRASSIRTTSAASTFTFH